MSRRPSSALRAAVLALLAAACSAPPPEPEVAEWPQFRGPLGLGISSEEGLPERWGPKSGNIRWQVPVPGAGLSSPVIVRGRVFLTTVYNTPTDPWGEAVRARRPKRVVLAYDLASGDKLWETVLFEGPVGSRHWTNTHATPTPATDGRSLFVSFDAHLAALDLDGNVLWHHDTDPEYRQHLHYGAATSLVLTDDAVVLMRDREEGKTPAPGWIAAFDKETGEQIWRDEWTHTCCSYSTPLVVERAGRTEVWNQTAGEAIGYDARTGEKLWRAEHPSSQTVPSLVRAGDLFSTPGGMHTKSVVMFRLSSSDGDAEPVPVWDSRRGVPEISSPVLYRDRLYTVAANGMLFVRDALTGTVLSRRRLPPGHYRPSIVAGDGKVYVTNEEGLTVVVSADDGTPEVISRSRLPAGSGASPAIADGSLFFRSKAHLYRVDRRQASSGADPASPRR